MGAGAEQQRDEFLKIREVGGWVEVEVDRLEKRLKDERDGELENLRWGASRTRTGWEGRSDRGD